MIQLTYTEAGTVTHQIMLEAPKTHVLQGVQTLNAIVEYNELREHTNWYNYMDGLPNLYDILSYYFVFNIVTHHLSRGSLLC